MNIVNYIMLMAITIIGLACNFEQQTTTQSEVPSVETVPTEQVETPTESVTPTVETTPTQEQTTLSGESTETTSPQTSTEVTLPPDEHLDC